MEAENRCTCGKVIVDGKFKKHRETECQEVWLRFLTLEKNTDLKAIFMQIQHSFNSQNEQITQLRAQLDQSLIEQARLADQLAQLQQETPIQAVVRPQRIANVIHCQSCQNQITVECHRCLNCVNYDLCDACYLLDGIHNRAHVLVRIPIVRFQVPLLNSQFISDITIPDGQRLTSNTQITKIWRLRNTGIAQWPRCTLRRTEGNHLNEVCDEIGRPLPGETTDVAIRFITQALPARFKTTFRLVDAIGNEFGQFVWVEFVI